jgi:hypothetical protein
MACQVETGLVEGSGGSGFFSVGSGFFSVGSGFFLSRKGITFLSSISKMEK